MQYENLSLWQAIRTWPRVTTYSLLLALNILLWGYDGAILGGVSSMPVFHGQVFGQKFDGRYIIPSMWYSLWAVCSPIGTMTGAAICGWLQDRTGRRWTLLMGGLISVGAITTSYFADVTTNPRATFLVAKLVSGIAIGTIMCSTQTYLSEVIPPRLRGPIFSLFPAGQLFGQLIGGVVSLVQLDVSGRASYRTTILSAYSFSAIPLILALVIPESPAWLLRKDDISRAKTAFRKLHGSSVASIHEGLFEEQRRAVNEERRMAQDRSATYWDCFRGSDRRRTLIVIFANGLPDMWGLNLLGNASYFLQMCGMPHDTSFIILILGVVFGIFSNLGSFWTVLRFGRRLLINVTLAVTCVIWLSVGIAGVVGRSVVVANYTAAGMILVVTTAGLGVWPVSYLVSSETSSLSLRSKTQGVSWLAGGMIRCAFDLGTPYLYNADAANLGAKTALIFVGTTAVSLVISFFCVPELKGRSLVEIDRMFQERLPTRQFRTVQRTHDDSDSEEGLSLQEAAAIVPKQTWQDVDSLQSGNSLALGDSGETTGSFEPLRKRTTF